MFHQNLFKSLNFVFVHLCYLNFKFIQLRFFHLFLLYVIDEARVRHSKWANGTPCWCECILYKGHRCGVCHNTSDAKVKIMKAPYEMKNKIKNQSALSKCECMSVPSVDYVRALYMWLWGLVVVVVNIFPGNAFGPMIGLLRGSQQSAWLIW